MIVICRLPALGVLALVVLAVVVAIRWLSTCPRGCRAAGDTGDTIC